MYECVIGAIQEHLKTKNILLTDSFKTLIQKQGSALQMVIKIVQSGVAWFKAVPTSVIKWNKKFDNLNWENIFTKCFKSTSDTQLIWFQARLQHHVLPKNRYLFTRKSTDSSLCFLRPRGWNHRTFVVVNFWQSQISKKFLK